MVQPIPLKAFGQPIEITHVISGKPASPQYVPVAPPPFAEAGEQPDAKLRAIIGSADTPVDTRLFENTRPSNEATDFENLFASVAQQRVVITRDQILFSPESSETTDTAMGTIADIIKRSGQDPKTVVYPASGFDISSALRVFPDADTFVLVDHNPLLKPVEGFAQSFDLEFVHPEQILRHSGQVAHAPAISLHSEKSGGMLLLILADLAKVSGTAFLEAEVFIEEARPITSTASLMVQPAHGMIRFEQNGRAKTIIYISGGVTDIAPHVRIGYKSKTDLVPVNFDFADALFVKGSQGALDPQKYGPAGNGANAYFLEILRRQGGLLVEGRHIDPSNSRFGEGEAVWEVTREAIDAGARVITLKDLPFSYFRGVKITIFGNVLPDIDKALRNVEKAASGAKRLERR
ncbi:MAG: hypothetical protein HYU98_06040 [Deltaproteobacteria bacterium]|nr:hypothetical protein [Deltaproteobacteria bacterium]